MQVKAVNVTIFGSNYTLQTEKDEQSIINLAKQVDDKMKEIARLSGLNAPLKIAILAALHLAQELKDKQETVPVQASTDFEMLERLKNLNESLEAVFRFSEDNTI